MISSCEFPISDGYADDIGGGMKAKLVHLTERQIEELTKEARKIGISVSELIRRVLDDHLGPIQVSWSQGESAASEASEAGGT